MNEDNPTTAREYFDRGILKVKLLKIRGAIEDYNKAIELDPSYAAVYNFRGMLKIEHLYNNKGAIKLTVTFPESVYFKLIFFPIATGDSSLIFIF